MQCYWLSFILVESFSFLQEFKIPFELRFKTFIHSFIHSFIQKKKKIQKINHSDCYKNWLLSSIWDMCWYQSLQSQISLLIYLFVYYFLMANCRNKNNTVFQGHTWAKVKLEYSKWQIFQVPFAHRNETWVRNLGKTGSSYIGPLWKIRPSSECKIVLI